MWIVASGLAVGRDVTSAVSSTRLIVAVLPSRR